MMRVSRTFQQCCILLGFGTVAAGTMGQVEVATFESEFEVIITSEPFEPRSASGETPFTRHEGGEFGLVRSNKLSPKDFYPPFFNGGGVASGDIDRDGWPDIVSATGNVINIYRNLEGKSFRRSEISWDDMEHSGFFNVALVDIDSDGWLDLFTTTYLNGSFYIINDQGDLSVDNLQSPPKGRSILSSAVSFGDIDRDGDLDAAVGNWFAGMSKQHPPPHSQNEILTNDNGKFTSQPLPGLTGETLSMLLSDWDNDGWLDLIVGNDFDAPDIFYRSDGEGGLHLVTKDDKIIPHSTHTTMSIDTADYDNDLDLDIFIDQITARATGPSAGVKALPLRNYCVEVEDAAIREECIANIFIRLGFFYGANHRPTNVKYCSRLKDLRRRQACIGMQVNMSAQRLNNPDLCRSIPDSEVRTRILCDNFFEETLPHNPEVLEQSIPQQMNENVLLTWNSDSGVFVDTAKEMGVGFTGWSWNAHFADVDNDEWQDLFVVAGSWFRATPSGTTANFFFRNEQGESFSDVTDDYGFQNYMIVSAYTIVDFDRDGDLDFVTNSINGPLWLLKNNTGTGNSIRFEIKDELGNRDGIGTKFIIRYGENNERQQIRELKSGGGYLSFDEPAAHFGLGNHESVTEVEVRWSTGGITKLPGPFKAGHRYAISRAEK